jgi:hypothetical protein
MKIPFKNENIYAMVDDEVVCSVPDLISVIDSDTGEAIGTPDYRYGLFDFSSVLHQVTSGQTQSVVLLTVAQRVSTWTI